MATKIETFSTKSAAEAGVFNNPPGNGNTYMAYWSGDGKSGVTGKFNPGGFGGTDTQFAIDFPDELDTVPDELTISGNKLTLKSDGVALASVELTKSALGLSNVDNTSDADKPISSAVQSALNGKAPSSHSHQNATASTAGFMSAADKQKLDGIDNTPPGWVELFGWRYMDSFGLDTDYLYNLPNSGVKFGVRRESSYPNRLRMRINISGGECEYYANTWDSYGEGGGYPSLTESVGRWVDSRGIYDSKFYAFLRGNLEADGDIRIQVINSGGYKVRMLYRP